MLEEAAHACRGILGGKHVDERLGLDVEAGRERAVETRVDRALGKTHRDDRAGGELSRPLECLVEHVAVVHHAVDEPDSAGLVGSRPSSAPDQLLGARRPDQARQALRAATSWNDAEQDLRLTQPRGLPGDTQIARKPELEPTAQSEAADRRDYRTGNRRDGIERGADGRADETRRRLIAELIDVGAGRECPSLTGDDNGFELGVGRELDARYR